jgi:phosphoserine phosphatase RsbU/P
VPLRVETSGVRTHSATLRLIHLVTDRLVRTLDFDEALTALIDGATDLLGVERASILILDAETKRLSIRVAKGLSPAVVRSTRIPLGTGIAGEVAATGKPIVLRDVREHPGWKSRRTSSNAIDYANHSALCVPLEIHGGVQGVMNFNDKRDGSPFDGADLDFALLIANQAAVVLFSAMLHKQFLDKQAIEQEIAIAGAIQARLLPQRPPPLAGFRFAAAQRMCRGVGGDYYDFVPLVDGRLAIAIGDVAGHGLGSALLAADARAALRECLAHGDPLEACLQHINDLLQADTSDEMYMTLLLGFLDPRERLFEFATAGHHMPVLLRQDRVERLPPVGSNIPLGVRRGLKFGLEEPLRLGPGDLLLLFTDGIWEETDGTGRRFGTSGLEAVLTKSRGRSEAAIVDAIFSSVAAHRASPEPEDDCTLVVMRCVETGGTAPRISTVAR